jgi:hypothetical protein
MSTTKLAKVRTLVLSGAAAAAVVLPLTLVTAPAHASTTLNGCTVTPLQPGPLRTLPNGQVEAEYRTRVSCVANRIVQVVDQRWEADAPAGLAGDDFYGSRTYLHTFAQGGTIILSARDTVDNTEPGPEETYHRVSFRVASITGVAGPTAFENSPLRVVTV